MSSLYTTKQIETQIYFQSNREKYLTVARQMKEYEDKKSKEWIDAVEVQLPGYLKRNLLSQPDTTPTLTLRTPHPHPQHPQNPPSHFNPPGGAADGTSTVAAAAATDKDC